MRQFNFLRNAGLLCGIALLVHMIGADQEWWPDFLGSFHWLLLFVIMLTTSHAARRNRALKAQE